MTFRDQPPGNLGTSLLEFRAQAEIMLGDPAAVRVHVEEAIACGRPYRALHDVLGPLAGLVMAHASGEYDKADEEDVSWALAAAMYVASPWDLTPDYLPGGLHDDLLVAGWVHERIRETLLAYVEWERQMAKRRTALRPR